MITVWKFKLPLLEEFKLDMPLDAQILMADHQPDVGPCLWARVNTHSPIAPRWFRVTGTGHEVPPYSWHIASFQSDPYVWHLWGVCESREEMERKQRMRMIPTWRSPKVYSEREQPMGAT